MDDKREVILDAAKTRFDRYGFKKTTVDEICGDAIDALSAHICVLDANGVIINTNNAETNVVVENGQTAVIGGLTTQVESKSHSGIPILKDIPLLGYLFRHTRTEVTNRDLVIFVTPTIVTGQMHGMNSAPETKESTSGE